jgi:hypothetical protein
MKLLNVLIIAVSLAGCVSVKMGRDFDPAVFQTFEVGKTTTATVLEKAGEPWLRQTMPDGLEVWTYLLSRSQAFALPIPFYTHVQTDGATKSVTLTFRNGVLTQDAAPLKDIRNPCLVDQYSAGHRRALRPAAITSRVTPSGGEAAGPSPTRG